MNRKTTILIHVAVWLVLLLSPLTIIRHDEDISLLKYVMLSMSPVLLMLVFYLNYLYIIPHYYFRGDRKGYRVINAVLVICLGVFIHYWLTFTHSFFTGKPAHVHHALAILETGFFIVRDILSFVVAVAIATAIRLAERWHHNEEARLAAEAARTDAELRNLRSQINPHFLLNTLNNIYALTAIDQQRAQDAIQQLSKMLRHMLYDNQKADVALEDEVQFLENYVSLMKIRLPQTVDVTFTKEITCPNVRIAPLIFISLVENAFKHGISPTEPSFVHISISAATPPCVICDIKNSNHPK